MRWAVALAVVSPAVLAAAFLLARLGGNQDLARTCLRGLRFLLAAELLVFVLLALIGFSYERRARAREAAAFHPPGQLIDIGGYRLHLYCTGSVGPTVVLEHGHRATYLDWSLVQPKVAQFARVCSYDRAGYGWSDPSPKDRVPSVVAEELHALLRAAGEKPPYVLVGHSFGALNAVMFAHKFPDEVAGVLLIDGARPQSLRQIPWRGRLWVLMMRTTMPFGLPRRRGWCDGGGKESETERAVLACRSKPFSTLSREDSAFPRTAQEMNAITNLGDVPLVVIARDPNRGLNPAAEARNNQMQQESTKLSTNSRFIVADGSGHDVPLARPDVIVEAVRELLRAPAPAGNPETR